MAAPREEVRHSPNERLRIHRRCHDIVYDEWLFRSVDIGEVSPTRTPTTARSRGDTPDLTVSYGSIAALYFGNDDSSNVEVGLPELAGRVGIVGVRRRRRRSRPVAIAGQQ